jgi:hypothetical protein
MSNNLSSREFRNTSTKVNANSDIVLQLNSSLPNSYILQQPGVGSGLGFLVPSTTNPQRAGQKVSSLIKSIATNITPNYETFDLEFSTSHRKNGDTFSSIYPRLILSPGREDTDNENKLIIINPYGSDLDSSRKSSLLFRGFKGTREVTGTAQGGAGTSITLAADSSDTDYYYNGSKITMTSGDCDEQTAFIKDYNKTTKVATINKTWSNSVTPASGDTYSINLDSNMAEIEVSHKGTDPDDKGIMNIKVNDGNSDNDLTTMISLSEDGITFSGGVTISGNLNVSGETSTVSSTNTTIQDTLIKLAHGLTGSPLSDCGLIITRGNGVETNIANKAFIWDESLDAFSLIASDNEDGTTAGNVAINGYEKLQISKLHLINSNGDGTALSNDHISSDGTNMTLSSGGNIILDTTSGLTIKEGSANIIVLDTNRNITTSNLAQVDIDCSGSLSLNSSGGAISIGNNADTQPINIGTGASARTITVGNSTGETAVNITSGTGSINIIGATQVTGTLTVGVDDSGHDVIFYGDTAGKNLTWDASSDSLLITGTTTITGATNINGNATITGAVTIGVDDSGHDVIFYGDTTGKNLTWDASADSLLITGTTTITGATNINGNATITGSVTIGVDDSGHDVIFYGDTAGKNLTWDASADSLLITGTTTITGATNINGNATITGAVTIGIDDSGHDVIFYGDTTGKNLTWDASADSLLITGTTTITGATNINGNTTITGDAQVTGAVTIGVDDNGHDVIFYGDTAGKNLTWDASSDSLLITGTTTITGATNINGNTTITGDAQVTGAVTIGVDDNGHDVIFYGDTTGKNLTWDASADSLLITGTTTITGATNINGNTTITGDAQVTGAVTIGVDDSGHDVIFYGDTAGKNLTWDASSDSLLITGATQITGALTVGVNDTGYDVKFYGETAEAYMLWDESTDDLILAGAAGLQVNGTTTLTGAVTCNGQFAASNTGGTFSTFSELDTTPSVSSGNLWKTHSSTQTLTTFDNGVAGQTITVISTGAVTYDVTGTTLKAGSTDIVTASGDITVWTYDGTNWYLVQFMDQSTDMGSSGVSNLNDLTEVSFSTSTNSLYVGTGATPPAGLGTDAVNNTSLGVNALDSISSSATANESDNNTCIGYNSGTKITTGYKNTCVGSGASVSGATGINQTSIGFGATCTGNNQVTLGGADVGQLRCNTAVIATVSDRRDKTNIEDCAYGEEFLNKIKPRKFTWDRRVLKPGDEQFSKNGKDELGFIAQEFQEAMEGENKELLNLVSENDPERFEIQAGNLLPIMVKAIQEMSSKFEQMSNKFEQMNNKFEQMSNKIKELESEIKILKNN